MTEPLMDSAQPWRAVRRGWTDTALGKVEIQILSVFLVVHINLWSLTQDTGKVRNAGCNLFPLTTHARNVVQRDFKPSLLQKLDIVRVFASFETISKITLFHRPLLRIFRPYGLG